MLRRMAGILGLALIGCSLVACAPSSEGVEHVAESEQAVIVNVYKIDAQSGLIINYEVHDPRPTDDSTYIWRTLDEVAAAHYPGTSQVVGTDFDMGWYYRDGVNPPETAECQDTPFE